MMGVNQRLTGAKVGLAPAGKSDKMEVGGGDRRGQCINEEAEVGEQNLAYLRMRFPILSLNAKALEKGKKKSVVRGPCWSGRGLIVEVDVLGRRRVSWDRKKGGVQKLLGASRAVERDRKKVGPKVCKWVARGTKQAVDWPVLGLGKSPRLTDTLASLLAPSQAFALEPKVTEHCAKSPMEADRAGLEVLGVIGGDEGD
ncbi:hypothetical protein SO802_005774 [Lithocarpus litseifolius]|uniref:Uncharacterized protein n=1 Tax=Lithocarpus litseifolius TaxID=425828 RepID=A0AAW2DNQ9_9ROSI